MTQASVAFGLEKPGPSYRSVEEFGEELFCGGHSCPFRVFLKRTPPRARLLWPMQPLELTAAPDSVRRHHQIFSE